MKKQNKFIDAFRPKSIIYFVVLILFSVITFFVNPVLAWIEVATIAVLFLLQKIIDFKRNARFNEYVRELSMSADSITKDFALNSVLPLAVLKNDNEVIWYNNGFEKDFIEDQNNETTSIRELIKGFPQITECDGNLSGFVTFKNKSYNILGTSIKDSRAQSNKYSMIYFIDVTEEVRLRKVLDEKSIVFGKIVIDNYDEVIGTLSEGDRAVIVADTDKHIFGWALSAEAFIKKLEKDKFLIIFEKKNLARYISTEFEKLRNLKECTSDGTQPFTLSIGIGADAETPVKANEYSASSIDMALGRGGDQVVVKNNDGFSFYGGNSKEVEKRTKVRSRVVAHALRELIESKDNVIIMGHRNSDLDFMGSALGLYRAVKTFNKNCYILLDEISPTIDSLCRMMQNNEEYSNVIVNNVQAELLLNENGMLIVCDTHRLALMPYPELAEHAETVVLIDHHRKSADFFSDTVLSYHETYSSSTSELVVEILQYISDNIKLTSIESMALYAGILLDTQNFTFKTGVRTFEAASYLRRCGLNTAEAKELLKSDLNNYILRNQIISSATIYKNNIAISFYMENDIKNKAIIAQSADELLNIKGITTTFVVYKSGGMYGISARSIGDINVQFIMEKLGGGGHQLSAGTQFAAESDKEALSRLKYEIDEYLKKDDSK